MLAVDVQKGSFDYASRFAFDAGGNLTFSEGIASVADLSLACPGNRNPLWRVPSLAASGIEVDVGARKVTIGELQSRGAVLRLVRERDGSLEMARLVKPTGAKGADPGGGLDASSSRKAVTERVAIDFEDRVPVPPVKLAIRDLNARAPTCRTCGAASHARPSRARRRSRATWRSTARSRRNPWRFPGSSTRRT